MPFGIDLTRWKQLFPFTLDYPECPDCSSLTRNVFMEEKYVRDPYTQKHWRGVRAYVCPECGKAIRAEEPADRIEG